MPDVLCLQDVSRWYTPGTVVLDRVALTVAAGEIVAVRGSNGSGKTTLLRLAAGIAAPCGGPAADDRAARSGGGRPGVAGHRHRPGGGGGCRLLAGRRAGDPGASPLT